ncbi:MAG: NUDIX domain-containing protein [Acidimicrobiales bacterium]
MNDKRVELAAGAPPPVEFRKIAERTVHEGGLFSIAVGTFESPDGQRFERDIVHHPGAVVVVPYDERSDEVVFVRQYRAALDKRLLEVPAGTRDVAGEPPEATAERELAEEAGLMARSWQLVGHFYNSPGFSDEESFCYLARDLYEVPDERHGVEEQHMTVERWPWSELGALVRTGEITDAKTIAALTLAREALAG